MKLGCNLVRVRPDRMPELAAHAEALGLVARRRFSRTEECADALRRLWTEPTPSFSGRHFAFDEVHFEPKPRTRPHPPLLFGGDSDAALRRALRFGDGWMSGGVATGGDEVAAAVARLRAARAALVADGDPRVDDARPFDVTVLHPAPTAHDLEVMARAGVDRVVVMPWTSNRDAGAAIERFAAMAREVVDVEASDADRR